MQSYADHPSTENHRNMNAHIPQDGSLQPVKDGEEAGIDFPGATLSQK